MIRVMLVDDEALIVQGLSKVIRWKDYGCEVVATAYNAADALRLMDEFAPDILFTDIRMPGMDGLTMVAAAKVKHPKLHITVLTAYRDFDYAQRAMHLGVCRYLLKPSNMDQLREALEYMVSCVSKQEDVSDVPSGDENREAGTFILRSAVNYMKEHYAEHLTLQGVAEQVYVSQWHLSKLLNGGLKKSFSDLLNEIRIDAAKELLRDPAMQVGVIALNVGFNDVAHFSRTFKKATGKTPLEYRSTLR